VKSGASHLFAGVISKALTPPTEAVEKGALPAYIHFERHPDDEWFDEVRITTVPRWKESYLSGDEWRTSATIQFFRKGVLLKSRGVRDVEAALAIAPSMPGSWAPAGNDDELEVQPPDFDTFCFQPGCSEKATVEYRIKDKYCRDGGKHEMYGDCRRRFCEKHKKRGDCALEDADDNYEEVPFGSPARGK